MKNILTQAGDHKRALRRDLLEEVEEQELYGSYERTQPIVENLCQSGEYEQALKELGRLRTVVDRFFDTVLVMAPDPEVRHNRLALLEEIASLFSSIADISEIVRDGSTPHPGDSQPQ
ncbi:MAG TPA: DALR anticodon-binding domain-containing protein, partial [Acidobacteriota bacterium]|nr:DALR anticodon-binding domain-containing protein [Acidobacteriota bacterium]